MLGVFFQAEDGIRDGHVTGVQTCALPISAKTSTCITIPSPRPSTIASAAADQMLECVPSRESRTMPTVIKAVPRSEERRVGKERRSRRQPYCEETNETYWMHHDAQIKACD